MLNLRKTKTKKATFHSYIGDQQNDSYLLPDECEVKRAANVHQESLFVNGRSGNVGTLIVTNFRVLFQPLLPDADQVNTRHYKLRGDHDLELCNIASIHQVSKGRKRRLTIAGSGLSHVKHIEIRCKNLMTQAYNLKATDKQEVKLILLALLHHIKPNNLTLLFCFDLKINSSENNLTNSKHSLSSDDLQIDAEIQDATYYPKRVDYNHRLPWNDCLTSATANGFKTVDCNVDFNMCPMYPKCFVIPQTQSVEDIQMYAGQFADRRVPVWCYSHCGVDAVSTSLSRSGSVISDPGITDSMSRYISCIISSCPGIVGVELMNLDRLIPYTIYDLRKSYKSLKAICMPESMKDLHQTDLHWFSKLEDTKWLHIVSSCLSLANRIVHKMADKMTSVIISETSCSDFTPLISCLVQLMLNPTLRSSRTLFQQLIDREWTAMGHQFKERYALTLPDNANTKSESPLFLLFMDCVSQLLVQYPTKFDISETLLVTICDCACSGLYSQFIFNNEKHRYTVMSCNADIMSAWQWYDIINSADNIHLFNNPLYDANLDGRRKKNSANSYQVHKPPKPPRKLLRQKYIQTLGAEYMPSYSTDFKFDQVLKVESSVSPLQFWSYYFLRWLTPVQINCGGEASQFIQRCIRSDEIADLRQLVNRLEKQLEKVGGRGGAGGDRVVGRVGGEAGGVGGGGGLAESSIDCGGQKEVANPVNLIRISPGRTRAEGEMDYQSVHPGDQASRRGGGGEGGMVRGSNEAEAVPAGRGVSSPVSTLIRSPRHQRKSVGRFSRLMSSDISSPSSSSVAVQADVASSNTTTSTSSSVRSRQWSRVISSSFPFSSYSPSDRSSVTLGAFLTTAPSGGFDEDDDGDASSTSQRTSYSSDVMLDTPLSSVDTPLSSLDTPPKSIDQKLAREIDDEANFTGVFSPPSAKSTRRHASPDQSPLVVNPASRSTALSGPGVSAAEKQTAPPFHPPAFPVNLVYEQDSVPPFPLHDLPTRQIAPPAPPSPSPPPSPPPALHHPGNPTSSEPTQSVKCKPTRDVSVYDNTTLDASPQSTAYTVTQHTQHTSPHHTQHNSPHHTQHTSPQHTQHTSPHHTQHTSPHHTQHTSPHHTQHTSPHNTQHTSPNPTQHTAPYPTHHTTEHHITAVHRTASTQQRRVIDPPRTPITKPMRMTCREPPPLAGVPRHSPTAEYGGGAGDHAETTNQAHAPTTRAYDSSEQLKHSPVASNPVKAVANADQETVVTAIAAARNITSPRKLSIDNLFSSLGWNEK